MWSEPGARDDIPASFVMDEAGMSFVLAAA